MLRRRLAKCLKPAFLTGGTATERCRRIPYPASPLSVCGTVNRAYIGEQQLQQFADFADFIAEGQ